MEAIHAIAIYVYINYPIILHPTSLLAPIFLPLTILFNFEFNIFNRAFIEVPYVIVSHVHIVLDHASNNWRLYYLIEPVKIVLPCFHFMLDTCTYA
jgi:hypothetical protein